MEIVIYKKISVRILIILTGIVLGFFIFEKTGFCRGSVESFEDIVSFFLDSNNEEFTQHSFLIYIIDFNDFMCTSCLNSFLEFYYILPPPFQNECAIGILVDSRRDQVKNSSKSQKIIKKKLSGFIQANRIGFPIFLDASGSFQSLSDNGTAVVVFSESLDRPQRYIFPLSAQEQEEIINMLFYPELSNECCFSNRFKL